MSHRGRFAIAGAALGLLGVSGATAGDAASGWTPLGRATWTTMESGRPTVIVVTSRGSDDSQRIRRGLLEIPEARTMLAYANFAEMPAEVYGEKLKELGVSTFPTIVVYKRGAKVLERVDVLSNPRDAYVVVGWLGTLGLRLLASSLPPDPNPAPNPLPRDERLSQTQVVRDAPAPTGPEANGGDEQLIPTDGRTFNQAPAQEGMLSDQSPPDPAMTNAPPPMASFPVPPTPPPAVVPAASAPVVYQPSPTQIPIAPTSPTASPITLGPASAASPNVYYVPVTASAPGAAPLSSVIATTPTAGAPPPSYTLQPSYSPAPALVTYPRASVPAAPGGFAPATAAPLSTAAIPPVPSAYAPSAPVATTPAYASSPPAPPQASGYDGPQPAPRRWGLFGLRR